MIASMLIAIPSARAQSLMMHGGVALPGYVNAAGALGESRLSYAYGLGLGMRLGNSFAVSFFIEEEKLGYTYRNTMTGVREGTMRRERMNVSFLGHFLLIEKERQRLSSITGLLLRNPGRAEIRNSSTSGTWEQAQFVSCTGFALALGARYSFNLAGRLMLFTDMAAILALGQDHEEVYSHIPSSRSLNLIDEYAGLSVKLGVAYRLPKLP
jgi:hypothetical protein